MKVPEPRRRVLFRVNSQNIHAPQIASLTVDPAHCTQGNGSRCFSYHEHQSQASYQEVLKQWTTLRDVDTSRNSGLASMLVEETAVTETHKFGIIELQRSSDFLKQVVMNDSTASEWIKKKVSIAWYMRYWNARRKRSTGSSPHIWICTSLVLNKTREKSSDPNAVSPKITINSDRIGRGSNYHREQIIAAEFQQVVIELKRPTDSSIVHEDPTFDLIEIENLCSPWIRNENISILSPVDGGYDQSIGPDDDGHRKARIIGVEEAANDHKHDHGITPESSSSIVLAETFSTGKVDWGQYDKYCHWIDIDD